MIGKVLGKYVDSVLWIQYLRACALYRYLDCELLGLLIL